MTMPSASDLPSLDSLKSDVRSLGHEAADLARDRLVRPAQDIAQQARERFREAGRGFSETTAQTEEVLLAQRDRATTWVSAHPLAAIGLAVGAGVLLSTLMRDRK